uniref:Uncharacterized protein n=1 Tax=Sphaerodactylus townsendi TaxID=933632 RepID=A0ACB8F1K7_9SAUR
MTRVQRWKTGIGGFRRNHYHFMPVSKGHKEPLKLQMIFFFGRPEEKSSQAMAWPPEPAFGQPGVRCNAATFSYGTGRALRRKRKFTPDEKKDTLYWEKRQKNNEAARRSREKRHFSNLTMESQVLALEEENLCLRVELLNLKAQFGLIDFQAHPHDFLDVQVYLPLQTCRFRGTGPSAPNLTYKGITLSRDLLGPSLEIIPSVRQYNFSCQPASNLKSHFLPNYLNYHLLPNCSCHFPTSEATQFPIFLPNRSEMGKEVIRNTSEEDGQCWTQIPSCELVDAANKPQMAQNYSALPHKLRIKTKYFGDDQNINGCSKPVGRNVSMRR